MVSMCCVNTCTIHECKYRLYHENEGLSDIHDRGRSPELVYAVTPSLNCIIGLYQNARHFQLACLELSNDLLAKNGNHKKCQHTVWVSHQVSHDVEVHKQLVMRSRTSSSPPFLHTDVKPRRKQSGYIRLGSSNGGMRVQAIVVKGNRTATTTVHFVPHTSSGTVASFQNSTIPLDTIKNTSIRSHRHL